MLRLLATMLLQVFLDDPIGSWSGLPRVQGVLPSAHGRVQACRAGRGERCQQHSAKHVLALNKGAKDTEGLANSSAKER